MQISRLFEIVYLLLERGSVTAGELSQRFEVSTRTIYRDIDVLSIAGIPVYASKGKGGGIRLLPEFVLNKSLLSEQEQNEILFALQSLKATGVQESQVLNRLSSLFRKDSTDWIDVDFTHWGSNEVEQKKFQVLKSGILNHQAVSFVYFSSNGLCTKRTVEPFKLRFKNSNWYLQAFCLEKQQYRTFKVIRMQEVCLCEGKYFQPRPAALQKLDNIPVDESKMVRLELWLSKKLAFRVYDEFGNADIFENEDGSFHVVVCFPENSWVYGYLLSFGENLKVLSPPGIQQILKEKAEKIVLNYTVEN